VSETVDEARRQHARKEQARRVHVLLEKLIKVNRWRDEGVAWAVIYERLGMSKATAFRKKSLLEELLERVAKHSQPGGHRG